MHPQLLTHGYFHAIGIDIRQGRYPAPGFHIRPKGSAAEEQYFKSFDALIEWWNDSLLRAAQCELISRRVKDLWHARPDLRDDIRVFAAFDGSTPLSTELCQIAFDETAHASETYVEHAREFGPLVWERPESSAHKVVLEFICEEEAKAIAQAIDSYIDPAHAPERPQKERSKI
ncbi:hypothetical protein RDV84_23785 [Lysobacter yananisis]|uniref:CdiI immunity protein domain-containing protein n=1 Tax=Lysobacter yananisis TaxID=1003114 RepID=A0ABY9P7A5_9GAMM|nr:hypothetical protein [Lysobacter yananisis]WMT02947.1 hypothetical protein RDV84_23785 [Lysobacter yananisis]